MSCVASGNIEVNKDHTHHILTRIWVADAAQVKADFHVALYDRVGASCLEEVKTEDLLSLLRVAYLASQKVKAAAGGTVQETCEYAEANQEIWRVPMWSLETQPEILDGVAQVAPGIMTGPTALIRLLIPLAKRGIIEESQTWTSLPPGTQQGTSLTQVKQILSPAVISHVLPFALKRVTAHRERGNTLSNYSKTNYARASYLASAELASYLVEFNKASEDKWADKVQGAQKELVLSLSSAAEMSLRKKEYKIARGFAWAANEIARNAPNNEGIQPETLAKNERRIDTANQHVSVVIPSEHFIRGANVLV